MTLSNTAVLILAGGFGTRLQTVVPLLPKPMAPINERPFLFYLLMHLYRQGIRQVYLSLHYRSETIMRYFGNYFYDMELQYFIEPTPLGTGGAILFCLNQIRPKQPIFIINGDTYSSCPLWTMRDSYLSHFQEKSILSVGITTAPYGERYHHLMIQKEQITSFQAQENSLNWINAGTYLASPELTEKLSLLGQTQFSFEKDFLSPHCQQYFFHAFPFIGTFIDIGIPEDYHLFEKEMSKTPLWLQ